MQRILGRGAAGVLAAALILALLTAVLPGAESADARTLTVSPRGAVVVVARGNGHGHGMSQWGAYSAARRGHSYRTILSFYYASTRLSTLHRSTIRVHLTGARSRTTVAAYRTLRVTGVRHTLPSTDRGVRRYRLAADGGSRLTLQRLSTARHARWHNVRAGLPDGAAFHQANGRTTRVFNADGTSNRYFGSIRAVRVSARGAAGGVDTVDRVGLDRYTAGVVPREMPASWPRAATDAQAVAARTYARYEMTHSGHSAWDICDTTDCQVYGGRAAYNQAGSLIGTDLSRAAADTAGKVVSYRGRAIFAQFSAANGGWASSGGQPYLRAHRDPFDARSPGDPWTSYSRRVSVRSIAAYYGMRSLRRITVTSRDGHGAWNGRVLGVRLGGTNAAGRAMQVHTSGNELQWALGVGTTWFRLRRA